jgi:hypothetical protein
MIRIVREEGKPGGHSFLKFLLYKLSQSTPLINYSIGQAGNREYKAIPHLFPTTTTCAY